MSRTSINPYCPYCRVRHDALKINRCRELDEDDDEDCEQYAQFGSCAPCGRG